MSDCDFKIIDDDQDNPTDNHMYMLQTLTSPELTRVVTGSTSSEATADLHAEATRICRMKTTRSACRRVVLPCGCTQQGCNR